MITICQVFALFVIWNVLFNEKWHERHRNRIMAGREFSKRHPQLSYFLFFAAIGVFIVSSINKDFFPYALSIFLPVLGYAFIVQIYDRFFGSSFSKRKSRRRRRRPVPLHLRKQVTGHRQNRQTSTIKKVS